MFSHINMIHFLSNTARAIAAMTVVSTIAFSDTLEEKIQAANAKIKEQESQQVHNDKELQKLVEEYNELIRQKELSTNNVEHIEVPIQSLDEALLQRMKEYENKLDHFDMRLKRIEQKLGITDVPAINASAGATPAHAGPAAHASTAGVNTLSPGIVKLDTPPHTSSALQGGDQAHALVPAAPTPADQELAQDAIETQKAAKQSTSNLDGNNNVAAQFDQASHFLKSSKTEDLKKAVEAFEDIINEFPDDEFAHKSYVFAGEASLRLKDYQKAEKYFESGIIKPLPEFMLITARLGYAKTLAAQHKKEDACKQLSYLKSLHMNDLQKKEHHALSNQCKSK